MTGDEVSGEIIDEATDAVADRPRSGADGPRRRHRRLAVAVAVTVGLVAGVVLLRGVLPDPTPPPRAPVLTGTGYDVVELGMRASAFRRAVCDGSCETGEVAVTSRDPSRACTHYVWTPPGEAAGDRWHWAWVRRVEVAAVGVVAARPDRTLLTDAGHRAGDPLDAADVRWRDWASETQVGRAILRREGEDLVQTLADLDGDGGLDYASVATPEGEECTPSLHGLEPVLLPAGGRAIDGTTLSGLALGTPAEEIGETWTDVGGGGATCRVLTRPQTTVPSVPETAYVRNGWVVGLASHAVRDGPVAAQPVDEALAGLDVEARVADLRIPGRTELRLWRPSLGEVVARDEAGRRLLLRTVTPVGYVPGLDWPAWHPDDGHAGTDLVVTVTVGQRC